MYGLTLVYALTVVGVIGAFYRPVIGLYVYVLLAVLRPHWLWGWAGDMDGLSWYVGVAMLLSWASRGFGGWKFGAGAPAVVALLFFTVWAGLSSLQANLPGISQAAVINIVKYVLPFLVGATLLKGEADARRMLWVIVGSQGFVAYELNMAYLNGQNLVHEFGFGGMDNNCFGIALVTTLGPAIALGLSEKKWWLKGLAAVATALILHTILLTFSRGAMLGTGIVILTSVFMMPLRPRNLAALALVLLLVIRFAGPEVVARFETTFASGEARDRSAESRIDLWKDCLTVAMSAPIFGIGPDQWPFVAANFGWTVGKSAHSAWMQSLAEVGFPGAFALLFFFVYMGVRLLPRAKSRRKTGHDPMLAAGIIMSMTGFVISAQFVTLQGLEVPYYLAIAGMALLKEKVPAGSSEAVPARVSPVWQPSRALPRPL